MTPWRWWWIEENDDPHGGWQGDFDRREQAIAAAQRELGTGDAFLIIEARSSTDMKYEGAECVPFMRTRNQERLIAGLRKDPSHG